MVRKGQTDLIVIGAGASGLAAARKLAGSGLKIAILEARDRIGGRIHTIHPSGSPLPIELGAEFVHGTPRETWEIIRAARLPVTDVKDTHWFLNDGELRQDPQFWDEISTILGRLDKIKESDLSFAQFLWKYCRQASPQAKRMALAFVEGFDAADSELAGVRGLAQEQEDSSDNDEERSFRLIDGYDGIIQWLAAGLDPGACSLHLNTVASKIEWERGSVIAHAAGGRRWQARKLLITIPIGVLKAPPSSRGAIEFDPEIREKRKALESIEMGSVVKTIFQFREPFWESERFKTLRQGESLRDAGFLHAHDIPVFTWWTLLPIRAATLVGWSGGPAAMRLSNRPQEQVIAEALASLGQFFGLAPTTLANRLESAIVADWQSDPFSLGAYSYSGVGGKNSRAVLATPLAGTLYFAGEATHEGQSGTVAGAIASGYRAAAQILAAHKRG